MARGGLPILLDGGRLERDRAGKFTELVQPVDLPTRGVWYVWLKASNPTLFPAVLTWTLDGEQPLLSSRTQVQVLPHAKAAWHSYSRFADAGSKHGVGFPMQVHVTRPGRHTLAIKILSGHGAIRIDRIALTLCFSARPTADGASLDHTGDPGHGRATFKPLRPPVAGFRDGWNSPPVRVTGRAYYVDAARGSDAKDGRSPGRAWKSLKRVNARVWQPGDVLFLRRGGRWNDSLAPRGSGTAQAWITIGAYGAGHRPLLVSPAGPAIALTGQSYWVIQDVASTVEPERNPGVGAIAIMSAQGPQPRGIRISNCVAFDTAGSGIAVGAGWEGGKALGNGYDGVVVENCLAFANSGAGIEIYGADQNGCRNSVIRDCTTWGNDGMAGMWIYSGQNGLIDRCLSYNNAVYNIWTWNAINVTMRGCEAFRGRPPGADTDCGGFDIDWGCQACTVEDCYSHHNAGTGFLLMGSGTNTYRGFPMQSRYNLCRNNVSEGDLNGAFIFSTFEHGRVHDNLFIGDRPGRQVLDFFGSEGKGGRSYPTGTEVFNNRIVTRHGAYPVHFTYQVTPALAAEFSLDHNQYEGASPVFARTGQWGNGGAAIRNLATFRRTLRLEAHGSDDPKHPATRRSPLPWRSWLAARRKCLAETGAERFGIPMDQPFRSVSPRKAIG